MSGNVFERACELLFPIIKFRRLINWEHELSNRFMFYKNVVSYLFYHWMTSVRSACLQNHFLCFMCTHLVDKYTNKTTVCQALQRFRMESGLCALSFSNLENGRNAGLLLRIVRVWARQATFYVPTFQSPYGRNLRRMDLFGRLKGAMFQGQTTIERDLDQARSVSSRIEVDVFAENTSSHSQSKAFMRSVVVNQFLKAYFSLSKKQFWLDVSNIFF